MVEVVEVVEVVGGRDSRWSKWVGARRKEGRRKMKSRRHLQVEGKDELFCLLQQLRLARLAVKELRT